MTIQQSKIVEQYTELVGNKLAPAQSTQNGNLGVCGPLSTSQMGTYPTYYPNGYGNWPYYAFNYPPMDTTQVAFRIAKALIEKDLLEVKTVQDFIKLIDTLAKEIY